MKTGLYQCMECGHGGWKQKELINGLCPFCQEEESDDDELNTVTDVLINNKIYNYEKPNLNCLNGNNAKH